MDYILRRCSTVVWRRKFTGPRLENETIYKFETFTSSNHCDQHNVAFHLFKASVHTEWCKSAVWLALHCGWISARNRWPFPVCITEVEPVEWHCIPWPWVHYHCIARVDFITTQVELKPREYTFQIPAEACDQIIIQFTCSDVDRMRVPWEIVTTSRELKAFYHAWGHCCGSLARMATVAM